ncbi:unnamed protein product [Bursaphelenchus xylophilus]|uniref:(pine wood nematode) hypothetical protein n=1 Tax=Bursaphelenchus xylophilus TaxID=6326 RepID=A0A1I7RVC1_BURXY|nr:unnamed protein product [Bursaphelenchus xylophilus]CAG9086662.1 unnamed protein product [Bursaphelenchus xylophilus]
MASHEKIVPVVDVSPKSIKVAANGGSFQLQITGTTDKCAVIRIKTTNNEFYRVKPVYAMLKGKEKKSVDVIRIPGPASKDKIIIQSMESREDEDPQDPFKAGCQSIEIHIEINAS